MNKLFSLIVLLAGLMQLSMQAEEEARLLRFPAIYEDQIVFSYAGDLFTVDAGGGIAGQNRG